MKTIKLNGKWDITLPIHRADRPEYNQPPYWEEKRLDKLYEVIKELDKPTVYYVGSEEGEMPALCQIWGAEVVLFEPNPKVWANTLAIWEANGLEEPVTYLGFCSQENQQLDNNFLQHGFPNCAYDEIEAAHGFKELHLEAENYNQIRLDSIKAHKPDIISIDVEGSEWEVLKGAEGLLKDKPKIFLSLHPEFLFRIYNEYQFDLRNWLKDKGYNETLLDYQHEVHLYYD